MSETACADEQFSAFALFAGETFSVRVRWETAVATETFRVRLRLRERARGGLKGDVPFEAGHTLLFDDLKITQTFEVAG
ncbi:MAG TPA: hypothetical protein VF656_14145 [Pyrinomonadaceae bacterium]